MKSILKGIVAGRAIFYAIFLGTAALAITFRPLKLVISLSNYLLIEIGGCLRIVFGIKLKRVNVSEHQ